MGAEHYAAAMSESVTPADWYPDPLGRHDRRYWDGSIWTEHVTTNGHQSTDSPTGQPDLPLVEGSGARVERQVARHLDESEARGAAAAPEVAGDGTIFGEPILVVNQKAKLIELNSEYAIYDQKGTQLGAVRQIGQTALRKLLRFATALDKFLTHRLQVVDMSGNVVLQITRPAKFLKSRIIIEDGSGLQVGQVVQDNVFGKIRFSYVAGGHNIGGIKAENWRAWNFALHDESGTEVGRITKTWEGLAKNLFTTADNYVLQIHRPLDEPLRSLVVASALSVDTALKQDSRGIS